MRPSAFLALVATWGLLAFPRPLAAEGESPAPPAPAPVEAVPALPPIMPLSDVRPGMKGYGLTVMAGTKIERFEIEVLDVVRTWLVKQDLILARCLGPAFEDHRIAQGMSGSPIYIDGKIVGALAYTWGWSKHALAGITPIETMLAEGTRPEEGRPTGAAPPTPLRSPRGAAGAATSSSDLRPIGTPLCVGGFSAAAREALAQEAGPLGFTLAAGGASMSGPAAGAWVDGEARLEPGCSLCVELMRGDFSAAALGTCTWVDGTRVHGFGHEFQLLGETLLPMSLGYVYTIVSSQEISFKLGAPLRRVGALVHDRPSGITGFTDRVAPMVPFALTFRNAVTKRAEHFAFEITPHTIIFQKLLISAVQDAFTRAEGTLGPNTKRYTMTVDLEGLEPFTYTDIIGGFDGGFQRVLIGLVDRVMNHESQRARFESVTLDVEVEHVDRRATITSATPSADEVRPGQSIEIDVRLTPREPGAVYHLSLPVTIPADAVAGDYVVAVMGGDFLPAEVPAPRDVADLPALFAAYASATEVVAVLPTGRVDLDLDGRIVRSIPLSSLPRLVRAPGGTEGSLRPVTEKVRRDVPFVVAGNRNVSLRVVR
jgi:hypothetical protein